jgi:hypothetical protein
MKKVLSLLIAMAAFAFATTSNATITSASWWPDSDGVLTCTYGWNAGQSTLWMNGTQSDVSGATTGHMLGSIQTDTPSDPTLTLNASIVNDTGSAWLGYQVNVVMNSTFSFVTPGPSVSNPADWFVAGVVNPTLQGGGPYAGKYLGTLYFSEGTDIGIGGELDFVYSINFSSLTDFTLTQEMIPLFTAIPEPSTFVLGGLGGLLLTLGLRRYRA